MNTEDLTQHKFKIPEINTSAFELELKYLYELQIKRKQLQECRQELNETIFKQRNLEWQLANEKRSNENNSLQSTFTLNLSKKLELEQDSLRKDLSQHKMQLDLVKTERDFLKQQLQTLHSENFTLKQELSELKAEYRCHSLFQLNLQEQDTKMKATLKQLMTSFEHLELKHKDVMEIKNSLENTSQLYLNTEEFKSKYETIKLEKENLENKLLVTSVELETLKELLKKTPFDLIGDTKKSVINYWKNKAEELETKWMYTVEANKELTNNIKILNDRNDEHLETQHKLAKRIDELESIKKNKQMEVQIYTETDYATN